MNTMAECRSPATSTSLTVIRPGFADVEFAADDFADLALQQFAHALESEGRHGGFPIFDCSIFDCEFHAVTDAGGARLV